MKKLSIALSILMVLGALLFAGVLFAAEGSLVDENGSPLEGYSNVYFDANGNPLPVYNAETGLWYSVIIVGTNEDGTIICRLGFAKGADDTGGGEGNTPEIRMIMSVVY